MPDSSWTRKFRSLQSQPIVWLCLVLLSLSIPSGIPAAAQTATNFAIGTTIQQRNVKRFGIDLGDQNYYDSGQMMKQPSLSIPGL